MGANVKSYSERIEELEAKVAWLEERWFRLLGEQPAETTSKEALEHRAVLARSWCSSERMLITEAPESKTWSRIVINDPNRPRR